ncbi:MAG: radical SAM protein [Anaerolineae bacterium]
MAGSLIDGVSQAAAAGTPLPVGDGRLPLFRLAPGGDEAYVAFYAPGCLCVVEGPSAGSFEADLVSGGGGGWAATLRRRAERALAWAADREAEPFRPECLTLYLHDECPLGCTYCYADPRPPGQGRRLEPAAVAAAADLVAANCRAKGLPFLVGFHGGGEPTLHGEQVEALLALVRGAAERHGVELRLYLATNGAFSEEKAAWVARHFRWVGLSCDGPADIHDAQRPDRQGRGSLPLVARAARVLREAGVNLRVRATITPAGLERQAEVADYVCRQMAPAEIHFEPLYGGGRSARGGLAPAQAEAWVDGFLQARAVAAGYGIPLRTSGTRPGELHGPHCQVLRQVLNLVPPGGLATACFKAADGAGARRLGSLVGALDPRSGRFQVDAGRVALLRRRLGALPAGCDDCFNRFHCAGECPDRCPLDDGEAPPTGPGFRCRAQRLLAARLLEERAAELWAQARAEPWAEGRADPGRRSRGIYGTTDL